MPLHPRRALLAFAVLLAACDPAPMTRSCTANADCEADEACVDGVCRLRSVVDAGTGVDSGTGTDAGPPVVLATIAVDPASADLVSIDGTMPTQAFSVIGTYSDGSTRVVLGPTFTVVPISLGEIDVASGLFTANGVIGGTATITARVPDPAGGAMLEATATVRVRLERTILGDGVPADVADRFTTLVTDDTRHALLVYPLDGAVMPQNVYPADVQWMNGAAGDLFRVTIAKPDLTVTAYLAYDSDPTRHWLVDGAAWRSAAQTNTDADATVTVDRFVAATSEAIVGSPVHVHFARAALTGSVYYWDIARGRIVRIDDGTATRNEFMPNPEQGCVGCHAVSPSGRYMAGRLGGGENTGTVYDLTTDLTAAPPAGLFATGRVNWWFSSWSPDETRLVVSQLEGAGPNQMAIYDAMIGSQVGVVGALPGNITHPAWAPDNSQIAYITNIGGAEWGGDNVNGDVATIDVAGPDAFGATRVLHSGPSLAGETPGGNADSYPTWAPDSSLIAFAHGTGSRSETRQSALYLMQRDGSGAVRLGRGSPGADDFQPRFSPFEEGGYFWMSFLTRRDYGNDAVGTRGRAFQQIWVTAIRTDAAPGEDGSSVAYWLPGQDTASRNISAYWAPRPCRPDGEGCSVGSECCGGDCRPDAGGTLVCSPPPPERCRMANETCSTSADCCAGLTCLGNVCVAPPE